MLIITLALVFTTQVFSHDFTTRETHFTNDSITLYADIYIPVKPRNVGVAIIQGSGNSSRSNEWSKAYAEALAKNGYHVLLPDKRGTGKSTGSWKHASLEMLAGDALRSVHHLRQEMKLGKVGIMGLSQGGFIAPVAAAHDEAISFVINISGATVKLEDQIIHEVVNTSKKEGLRPQSILEVLDLHILMKNYARDRNLVPLQQRWKELEKSDWAAFAQTFPRRPDLWVWDWLRLNIDFDPIGYWKKVKQPVFIAYGSKDEQDNVPVYNSVYRLQEAFHGTGNRNFQVHVYNAGHALYEDDKAELRSEMIGDLLGFLAL